MSKAWAGGTTSAWRRIRRRVLDENRRTNAGACTVQLPGVCTGRAEQVHHTLGRGVTGDDPRYLAAVCKACNWAVGEPRRSSPPHKRVTSW
jgi:hypothetical protein